MLLASPARVYNSKTSGGRLAGGHSRTISLASHLPTGAAGAIVNLSLTDTVTSGELKIHAAGTAAPSATITWFGTGQALTNQVMTAIGLNRSITISAGGTHSTQFTVDLIGYLI